MSRKVAIYARVSTEHEAQISALEEKIAAAKRVMADCPEKKQAILNKWLR